MNYSLFSVEKNVRKMNHNLTIKSFLLQDTEVMAAMAAPVGVTDPAMAITLVNLDDKLGVDVQFVICQTKFQTYLL